MLLDLRIRLLRSAGRGEEASAVRAQLVEEAWEDSSKLNQLAWDIAASGDSTDLELAVKAARQSSKLRDDKSPAVLDTLARCYYELGQLDEAIKWQRLASEHNNGFAEIETTLKRYLKEKSESEQIEASQEIETDDTESPDSDAVE